MKKLMLVTTAFSFAVLGATSLKAADEGKGKAINKDDTHEILHEASNALLIAYQDLLEDFKKGNIKPEDMEVMARNMVHAKDAADFARGLAIVYDHHTHAKEVHEEVQKGKK